MHRSTLLFALALLALAGCSTTGETPQPEQDPPVARAQQQQPPQPEPQAPPTRDFSPQVLYLLLSGEIAAQRGRYDVTLVNYTEAAEQSRDIGVIRRALLVANSLNSVEARHRLVDLWLEIAPESVEAHRVAALQALQEDDLETTMAHLEIILDLEGDANFDSLAAMAGRLTPPQQNELLQLYQDLGQRHPDNVEIRYGTALLQKILGQPQAALGTLQPLLQTDPEFQPALVLRGDLLYQTGRVNEALSHLQTATRRYPGNRQLGTLYGRMLVSEGELRAAQDEFDRLVQRFPDTPDLRLSYALVAFENNELGLAREQLEQLVAQGQRTSDAYYYLGRIAESENNPERALELYGQVAEGSHFFPALARASELLAERGDTEAARERIRTLRQRNPEQAEQLWQVEVNFLLQQGHETAAMAAANTALEAFPGNTRLLYSRAMLLESVGRLDDAIADLQAILAQEPDNATALNALGYILTVNTERYDEAQALIEQALALDPDNPAILDSMGWVLFQQGETESALDYLRQAFAAFPDPEVAAHYGEVLWHTGDQAQARVVWRRGLEEDPDHTLLNETLQRLDVDLGQ